MYLRMTLIETYLIIIYSIFFKFRLYVSRNIYLSIYLSIYIYVYIMSPEIYIYIYIYIFPFPYEMLSEAIPLNFKNKICLKNKTVMIII